MVAAALHKLTQALSPERLAGPILGKELRVLSRRRRYYLLRFVFVGALAIFAGVLWAQIYAAANRFGYQAGAQGFMISRMAQAGRRFAMSIALFQFAAVHVLTPALLCGAIREELRHQTLNALMATPITGGQIVVGKLLSKLLPVFLALGMSLPVMAAARVFGGVPWDFVLSTTCISATAAVLIGSLCLLFGSGGAGFFSVLFPVAIVYGIPVYAMSLLVFFIGAGVTLLSPYWAMVGQCDALETAGQANVPWWPIHCALMLVVAAVSLAIAARRVRATALRAADLGTRRAERRRRRRQKQAMVGLQGAREAVRRVNGSPLIWKELRFYTPGTRRGTLMAAVLVVAVIAFSYTLGISRGDSDMLQLPFLVLYFLAATTVTVGMAAGTISSERESRALGLLLSVPVSDEYIVGAKFLGVVYRAAPPWVAILLHTVVFTIAGVLRPIVILHVTLIALAMLPFLSGLGMYLSSRCRSTTNAAVLSLILCVLLWGILPQGLAVAALSSDYHEEIRELSVFANPFVQLITSVQGALVERSWLAGSREGYRWFGVVQTSPAKVSWILLVSLFVYSLIGLELLFFAKRSLRRMAFES
jgi:ABC-type transport system involved in multi-copper enzyme maturation permease subunit